MLDFLECCEFRTPRRWRPGRILRLLKLVAVKKASAGRLGPGLLLSCHSQPKLPASFFQGWEVEEVKHPANASRFPRSVVSSDEACSLTLNAFKLFRILVEVGVPHYSPIFQGGSNENDVRKAFTLLRAVPEIPA